jgi:hypothetical protein
MVADEGVRRKKAGVVQPPKAPPGAGLGVRPAPSILLQRTPNMASASVRFGSTACAE